MSTRSLVSSSNFALVRFISKCFGPSDVAVMNGRLIFVVVADESSFFAFSALEHHKAVAAALEHVVVRIP